MFTAAHSATCRHTPPQSEEKSAPCLKAMPSSRVSETTTQQVALSHPAPAHSARSLNLFSQSYQPPPGHLALMFTRVKKFDSVPTATAMLPEPKAESPRWKRKQPQRLVPPRSAQVFPERGIYKQPLSTDGNI